MTTDPAPLAPDRIERTYLAMSPSELRAVVGFVITVGHHLDSKDEWSMEDNFQTTEGLADVYLRHVRHRVPPKHPLDVGQPLYGGTVVAWGYLVEAETTQLSVLTLLDEEHRVPNEVNYAVFVYEVETERVTSERHFPNIVPAVRAYETEYGMDY